MEMEGPSKQEDSLGRLKEWQLFEQKVHLVDGKQRTVGFNAPGGKWYNLEEGEELVFNMTPDGKDRKAFIRKGGTETPFEQWKEKSSR